jgi:hypothetical protein
MEVVAQFNNNNATQAELDIAQVQFCRDVERANYKSKVSKADAAKHPWKPVVEVVQHASSNLCQAIGRLGSDVTETLEELRLDINNNHMYMMAELGLLRTVSSTPNLCWRSTG